MANSQDAHLPHGRPLPADGLPSHDTPETSLAPDLPPPENKRFYPALNGLRAVAVLLVIFQHYVAPYHLTLNWGWTGVDIFFVLSGFLITGILYDTRDQAHRVRNFYMRRTLRIFPLYYAVLIGALLTTPIFHWLWNPAWVLWFCYLGNYARFVFIHSPLFPYGAIEHLRAQPVPRSLTLQLGHFWSLCVEEQFYLVWPMVVFTLRKRETLRNLCLASIPVLLAARIACLWLVPQIYLSAELLYRFTPLRADALLIGGFAALAIRGPEAARVLRLARFFLIASVIGFFLWELCYRQLGPTHTFYQPYAGDPVMTTIGYTLIDLFSAALVLNLLSLDNPLALFFDLRPLRRLGEISYGVYVFHDMFHLVYVRFLQWMFGSRIKTGGVTATAVLALCVSILLASLSYKYFETPFLRLKNRYAT
jgi:peptidoglycan/LPS O-acetylase OafA/YrhL